MKVNGFFALVWFIGAIAGFVYLTGFLNALAYFGSLVVSFLVLYVIQEVIRNTFGRKVR